MEWLNYHHLLYFWVVAREGSISRACQQLHLSQPTISSQLRKLEKTIGTKLFERAGRGLVLTETGRILYRYADEIFSLGREMMTAVRGRSTGQPIPFVVGVPDVLPKLLVYRLLRPALSLLEPLRLVCREGSYDELLADLATHSVDVVLSDRSVAAEIRVKAYNHLLGESRVGVFGTSALARKLQRDFPQSLHDAPMLLPLPGSLARRQLDDWFDRHSIRPQVIAEFEDSALLKAFGQEGLGVFAASLSVATEIRRQFRVELVGEMDGIVERYYAISVERKIKHPAVLAISNAARTELFH